MSPRWFTVPDRGSAGPPLTGSVVIPTVLIEITRQRLEQDRVDAIAASDAPLSAADRKALEEGLLRAQEEYAAARDRLRAITGRLTREAPRRPAARAS